MSPTRKQVAVVIGATSKWQADGRNTKLAHGKALDDSDLPVGIRWGIGGAIAQKFAKEGFFVVLTTRAAANASALAQAIEAQGGESMTVEMDLVSQESIAQAFATIREQVGDPHVVVYNAGYLEGRDLPPEKELLEHIPVEMFETAQHIASRGPFLVAKEVLPAMRKRGEGSFLITNNSSSLRGRKRMTGQSLVLPAHDDAHAGASADGGVFRAWRARGQRRHRRPDRFARHARPAARPAAPGDRHEPREDRRGVLLSAHPGQILLDARAAVDAVRDEAELLTTYAKVALACMATVPPGVMAQTSHARPASVGRPTRSNGLPSNSGALARMANVASTGPDGCRARSRSGTPA